MSHLDCVAVKWKSGQVFRRGYGALLCHLMRINTLISNALLTYLALSLLLFKKVQSSFFLQWLLLVSNPSLQSFGISCICFADIQQWRLVCLALGFTLLLVAPIISNWVPFYYSSSMTIGVFLVIIILLFQVNHLSISWGNPLPILLVQLQYSTLDCHGHFHED